MGMNKNTILGWATLLMIVMGLLLIGLGAFRYDDVAGWGFACYRDWDTDRKSVV